MGEIGKFMKMIRLLTLTTLVCISSEGKVVKICLLQCKSRSTVKRLLTSHHARGATADVKTGDPLLAPEITNRAFVPGKTGTFYAASLTVSHPSWRPAG